MRRLRARAVLLCVPVFFLSLLWSQVQPKPSFSPVVRQNYDLL